MKGSTRGAKLVDASQSKGTVVDVHPLQKENSKNSSDFAAPKASNISPSREMKHNTDTKVHSTPPNRLQSGSGFTTPDSALLRHLTRNANSNHLTVRKHAIQWEDVCEAFAFVGYENGPPDFTVKTAMRHSSAAVLSSDSVPALDGMLQATLSADPTKSLALLDWYFKDEGEVTESTGVVSSSSNKNADKCPWDDIASLIAQDCTSLLRGNARSTPNRKNREKIRQLIGFRDRLYVQNMSQISLPGSLKAGSSPMRSLSIKSTAASDIMQETSSTINLDEDRVGSSCPSHVSSSNIENALPSPPMSPLRMERHALKRFSSLPKSDSLVGAVIPTGMNLEPPSLSSSPERILRSQNHQYPSNPPSIVAQRWKLSQELEEESISSVAPNVLNSLSQSSLTVWPSLVNLPLRVRSVLDRLLRAYYSLCNPSVLPEPLLVDSKHSVGIPPVDASIKAAAPHQAKSSSPTVSKRISPPKIDEDEMVSNDSQPRSISVGGQLSVSSDTNARVKVTQLAELSQLAVVDPVNFAAYHVQASIALIAVMARGGGTLRGEVFGKSQAERIVCAFLLDLLKDRSVDLLQSRSIVSNRVNGLKEGGSSGWNAFRRRSRFIASVLRGKPVEEVNAAPASDSSTNINPIVMSNNSLTGSGNESTEVLPLAPILRIRKVTIEAITLLEVLRLIQSLSKMDEFKGDSLLSQKDVIFANAMGFVEAFAIDAARTLAFESVRGLSLHSLEGRSSGESLLSAWCRSVFFSYFSELPEFSREIYSILEIEPPGDLLLWSQNRPDLGIPVSTESKLKDTVESSSSSISGPPPSIMNARRAQKRERRESTSTNGKTYIPPGASARLLRVLTADPEFVAPVIWESPPDLPKDGSRKNAQSQQDSYDGRNSSLSQSSQTSQQNSLSQLPSASHSRSQLSSQFSLSQTHSSFTGGSSRIGHGPSGSSSFNLSSNRSINNRLFGSNVPPALSTASSRTRDSIGSSAGKESATKDTVDFVDPLAGGSSRSTRLPVSRLPPVVDVFVKQRKPPSK